MRRLKLIEVEHCPTLNQLADGFTKALKIDKFVILRRKLGIVSFEIYGLGMCASC
jgi:hypothetical protein